MAPPARAVSFPRRHPAWTVAFAVVAVLAVAALLFDWNWFRPVLEARLSAALGRKVTIDHLGVELSRAPLVTLDHITVANPPDFPPDSHLGEIDRLSMRIDLASLWRGPLVIPELTIDHPVSRLERNQAGEPNWKLVGIGDGNSSSPPAQIVRLTINDGHAHLDDPVLKSNLEMTIHTDAGGADGTQQIVVQGKGTYAGEPTTISLRGGSLLALRQADVRYPVDLRWDIGPTHLALKGTVDDPASFAGLDGMLDLSGPDLALLYPILGLAMPPTPPYHLKGKVAYADRVVRFKDFAGSLGGSDLSGNLSVDTSGERPRLDGDLVSRKIVFADLAGFVGGTPGKADAPNATPQRRAKAEEDKASDQSLPTREIDLAKLNAMDAHVTYRGKRIEADYLPIDDLDAQLVLGNGQLHLPKLNFGVGNGTVALKVDIDSHTNPPPVKVVADFRHLDLQRIMQKTKSFQGFGTIGGHADIASRGRSMAEIMANGSGGITLVMSGGEISALLTELAGLELAKALAVAITDKTAKFDIRCMIADSELQTGVATMKTLVFDTTETTLTGTGAINFRDESLKLTVASYPKNASVGTFRAPIDISGTFKHPSVFPDPAVSGARVSAMVGLGILLPGIGALIPTIELGLGEDSDCRGLIAAAKRAGPEDAAAPAGDAAKLREQKASVSKTPVIPPR
jgi:uncharacterized protein involved in outer membrane biogenesis